MRNRIKLAKVIKFPLRSRSNGQLVMMQEGLLPFAVKRILSLSGMKRGDQRGAHTHHKTKQVLLALSGSCAVALDDGGRQKTVKLKADGHGLFLPPLLWHVMKDFAPGTVLLVLADTMYVEKDYLRSYQEFLKLVK